MAVRLEGQIKRYIGLSDDAKPDHQTETIQAGSSFLESNTGRIYRSTGSAWLMFEPVEEQDLILSSILQELVKIRLLAEFRAEVTADELAPA